jgi:hypothetical protein
MLHMLRPVFPMAQLKSDQTPAQNLHKSAVRTAAFCGVRTMIDWLIADRVYPYVLWNMLEIAVVPKPLPRTHEIWINEKFPSMKWDRDSIPLVQSGIQSTGGPQA